MEVKYKRADELDCGDVIVIGGIETVIEYLEVVSGYILINKNEVLAPPEAQLRLVCRAPSDLEIVQKALGKIKLVDHRSANVDFFGNGSWVVWNYSINAAHQVADGSDLESLLTWAKQTIGGWSDGY